MPPPSKRSVPWPQELPFVGVSTFKVSRFQASTDRPPVLPSEYTPWITPGKLRLHDLDDNTNTQIY
eukprot:9410525-Pyramimonas_sp.AAC.1